MLGSRPTPPPSVPPKKIEDQIKSTANAVNRFRGVLQRSMDIHYTGSILQKAVESFITVKESKDQSELVKGISEIGGELNRELKKCFDRTLRGEEVKPDEWRSPFKRADEEFKKLNKPQNAAEKKIFSAKEAELKQLEGKAIEQLEQIKRDAQTKRENFVSSQLALELGFYGERHVWKPVNEVDAEEVLREQTGIAVGLSEDLVTKALSKLGGKGVFKSEDSEYFLQVNKDGSISISPPPKNDAEFKKAFKEAIEFLRLGQKAEGIRIEFPAGAMGQMPKIEKNQIKQIKNLLALAEEQGIPAELGPNALTGLLSSKSASANERQEILDKIKELQKRAALKEAKEIKEAKPAGELTGEKSITERVKQLESFEEKEAKDAVKSVFDADAVTDKTTVAKIEASLGVTNERLNRIVVVKEEVEEELKRLRKLMVTDLTDKSLEDGMRHLSELYSAGKKELERIEKRREAFEEIERNPGRLDYGSDEVNSHKIQELKPKFDDVQKQVAATLQSWQDTFDKAHTLQQEIKDAIASKNARRLGAP